jgi:hypothetical protein
MAVAKADRTVKTTDGVEVKVGDVVHKAFLGLRRGPNCGPSITEYKVLAISPTGDVAVATKKVRSRLADGPYNAREIPDYQTRYNAHLFFSREACKAYIVKALTQQQIRAAEDARAAAEQLTLAESL